MLKTMKKIINRKLHIFCFFTVDDIFCYKNIMYNKEDGEYLKRLGYSKMSFLSNKNNYVYNYGEDDVFIEENFETCTFDSLQYYLNIDLEDPYSDLNIVPDTYIQSLSILDSPNNNLGFSIYIFKSKKIDSHEYNGIEITKELITYQTNI